MTITELTFTKLMVVSQIFVRTHKLNFMIVYHSLVAKTSSQTGIRHTDIILRYGILFLLHKQCLQLQSEEIRYAENWIKRTYIFLTGDKKATRDEDVAGDVLKLLGEDGLKLMTQLINNTWNWRGPKDFNEVTMYALRNKPKVLTCDIRLCYSVNKCIKFDFIS